MPDSSLSNTKVSQKQLYKILAIDGGGIRGIISAMVLADIEREIEKPLVQRFTDFVLPS